MKTHEILYIISVFLIILSAAFYLLSTTVISGIEEDSVANIIGKSSELDSTISVEDAILQVKEMEKERYSIFLWIGIPVGLIIFLGALVLKRIKEGPDMFVDQDDYEFD